MNLAVDDQKRRLRAEVRARLAGLTDADRAQGSARITGRLLAATEIREARTVLAFVALRSEPDLAAVRDAHLAVGGTWLLPRWEPARKEYLPAAWPSDGVLVPGPFGVLEPPASAPGLGWEQLDLILVPGLAFDRRGWRLGRGRGFYDRLLARVPRTLKWGVAFDAQVVAEVPHDAHDVNLDRLVTPELWLPFGPNGLT